jgi:hypothetical protein
LGRHEAGGASRCQAARFQHDDPAAFKPRLVQEGQRHPRRFARARFGHKHGIPAGSKSLFQVRQHALYGQWFMQTQGCFLHLTTSQYRPSECDRPYIYDYQFQII